MKRNLLLFLGLCCTGFLHSQTTTFNYSGIIETYIVPNCVYKLEIEAKGASGGQSTSSLYTAGKGAVMFGHFDVNPGDTLLILVGECPSILNGSGNGGGGGSFVVKKNGNVPLLIAGGGAGSADTDYPLKHGTVNNDGNNGMNGGAGGIAGNGGKILVGASFNSGSGGGFYTDGENGWTSNTKGIAFVNGGLRTTTTQVGGFGGGGSGSGWVVGGAGGGYSGGGSGNSPGCGGGGGSFNIGYNQVNVAGTNVGHGVVTITAIPTSTNLDFTVDITPLDCHNGNTAQVNLTPDNPGETLNFNFNSISFSSNTTYDNLTAGTYYVIAQDVCGNTSDTTWINILNPPSINITSLQITQELTPNGGGIQISATGGTGNLVYVLNGTDTSSTGIFLNLSAGNYTVQVVDENGCIAQTSAVINSYVGNEEINVDAIQLFPIPVVNELNISGLPTINNANVEIVDVKGSVIYSKQMDIESNLTLSTKDLKSGIYFIRITQNGDNIVTSKFVK